MLSSSILFGTYHNSWHKSITKVVIFLLAMMTVNIDNVTLVDATTAYMNADTKLRRSWIPIHASTGGDSAVATTTLQRRSSHSNSSKAIIAFARCRHYQKKEPKNKSWKLLTPPTRMTSTMDRVTKSAFSLYAEDSGNGDRSAMIVDQSTIKSIDVIHFQNSDQKKLKYDMFCQEILGCSIGSSSPFQLREETGETTTPPFKIGLHQNRDDLHQLKERLLALEDSAISSYQLISDEYIQIIDSIGNTFDCRSPDNNEGNDSSLGATGPPTISYIEFNCPLDTATKISEFYECVFDATTSVIEIPSNDDTPTTKICIVAIGDIDTDGRSQQSLLFREQEQNDDTNQSNTNEMSLPIKITMTVGDNSQDYKQALQNAKLTGIVSLTSSKTTLQSDEQKQENFQFHNVVDMETGNLLFKLSHEIQPPPSSR